MNMTLKGALACRVLSLLIPCLLVCLQAGCTTNSPMTRLPTDPELQRLQGHWEGAGAAGKCSITITGNSLHFYARTDFWFATTITLRADTDPRQLHATIKDCAPGQESSVGKVVFAIFKIEDETLTLAVEGDEPPKSFSEASSHYNLKKVQPQRTNAEASISEEPERPNNAPRNPDPVGIFDGIITLPF